MIDSLPLTEISHEGLQGSIPNLAAKIIKTFSSIDDKTSSQWYSSLKALKTQNREFGILLIESTELIVDAIINATANHLLETYPFLLRTDGSTHSCPLTLMITFNHLCELNSTTFTEKIKQCGLAPFSPQKGQRMRNS